MQIVLFSLSMLQKGSKIHCCIIRTGFQNKFLLKWKLVLPFVIHTVVANLSKHIFSPYPFKPNTYFQHFLLKWMFYVLTQAHISYFSFYQCSTLFRKLFFFQSFTYMSDIKCITICSLQRCEIQSYPMFSSSCLCELHTIHHRVINLS